MSELKWVIDSMQPAIDVRLREFENLEEGKRYCATLPKHVQKSWWEEFKEIGQRSLLAVLAEEIKRWSK